MSTDWYGSANALLRSLTSRYDDRYGLGTMSASIYDTAWVALVSRTIDGQKQWIFPESFQFIYDQQAEDGSFPGDGSVADAVINTLACLLAFKHHESTWNGGKNDIAARSEKAVAFLNTALQTWDVKSTERIALEMIVPSLFEQLATFGLDFDFPQRKYLFAVREKKLSMVDIEIVYKHHTTVLHSLEAFVGKIDFDRIAHHVRGGSLMASPSSTAAYLTYASKWDEAAEGYLRHVIEQCKSYGYGAVCNVWPTTVFEFSWSVCNLVESGFDLAKLDQDALARIRDVLYNALAAEKGIIGFAANVGPDSDDTAKALTALTYLGKPFPYDALLKTFELPTHFQCFQFERNPSFSANCNILIALLRSTEPKNFTSQVIKAATFITEEWWTIEGPVEDKWHLSQWYPAMLASQGLLRLLYLHGQGLFSEVSEHLLTVKIPLTLFGILIRVLQSQHEDGSWGVNKSREETAYAILALANLASLPYVDLIRDQVNAAVAKGREYLLSVNAIEKLHIAPADYIWVGKIGYGVEHVCNGYVVSAMHIPVPLYEPASVDTGVNVSAEKIKGFAKFYSRLPMYQGFPQWRMYAWLIESFLFLPELRRVHHIAFDRQGMKEDPYFEYLPFSWTGPNGMEETYASAQTIFDMIVISMVNFQVDEFFDIVVQKHGEGALAYLRTLIDEMMAGIEKGIIPPAIPQNAGKADGEAQPTGYDEIRARLGHFVNFVFTYPRIEFASENDKAQLRKEMKIYLHAHTTQCEDNVKLQAQAEYDPFLSPRSSYLKWVRSTAADHLSSQYAFAFITCLLGHSQNKGKEVSKREDYFPTAEIKYIAQDCSTHLSVICRIFNDWGSMKRDREEKNLNAVFFPEFEGRAKGKDEKQLKAELRAISEYERKCLNLSFDELLRVAQRTVGPQAGKRLHEVVRLFYNASEMYTEIYEFRDISTWN